MGRTATRRPAGRYRVREQGRRYRRIRPPWVGIRPVRDRSSRAGGTARIRRISTRLATAASSGPALAARAATRELVAADHANTNQELVQAAHTQLATARVRAGN
jgi:hypothetical protein